MNEANEIGTWRKTSYVPRIRHDGTHGDVWSMDPNTDSLCVQSRSLTNNIDENEILILCVHGVGEGQNMHYQKPEDDHIDAQSLIWG